MVAHIVCPRCGARDSFIKGYLPDTCVCRVCQSQLGWREIPGCGPDCSVMEGDSPSGEVPSSGTAAGEAASDGTTSGTAPASGRQAAEE